VARYVPREGWITKWRRYQGHRFYFLQEGRAATRGEAWEDLLFAAAWKPHDRYFKGKEYRVNAGQIITSQHDLAARWQWSRTKVASFLEDLEAHGEASHETRRVKGHVATLITVHGLVDYATPAELGKARSRPTLQATIEEVKKGSTKPLSSNKVERLVQWTSEKMGKTKKKG